LVLIANRDWAAGTAAGSTDGNETKRRSGAHRELAVT
jgi:hypothetical protein